MTKIYFRFDLHGDQRRFAAGRAALARANPATCPDFDARIVIQGRGIGPVYAADENNT